MFINLDTQNRFEKPECCFSTARLHIQTTFVLSFAPPGGRLHCRFCPRPPEVKTGFLNGRKCLFFCAHSRKVMTGEFLRPVGPPHCKRLCFLPLIHVFFLLTILENMLLSRHRG